MGLARNYFEPYRRYFGISPIPPDEKYGRIDVERLRIAFVGLSSIAAAVAKNGLEAIADGAEIRSVDHCFRLLDCYVAGCLAADVPEAALALLTHFQTIEACRDFANLLAERCLLKQGRVAAVEALSTPEERARSVTFEILERDAWGWAESVEWLSLIEDPSTSGNFEVAWPDGDTLTYGHTVPSTQLTMSRPSMLTVRRGEILRGGRNCILRPQKFCLLAVWGG
jgi:hypothetical protein